MSVSYFLFIERLLSLYFRQFAQRYIPGQLSYWLRRIIQNLSTGFVNNSDSSLAYPNTDSLISESCKSVYSHRLNAIAFEQHIREFINQRQSSEKKLALSHFLLNHFQIWKDLLHAQQVFEVSLSIIIGSASTWLATELANRLRFAADHNSHHVHAFIRRL